MNYRNISDLNQTIVQNLHRIPADIDLIVAIPRSGLLPASLIALYLNLPLTDLEGLRLNRFFQTDKSRRRPDFPQSPIECKRVLIIDDSAYSGAEMNQARTGISSGRFHQQFYYAVVYGHSNLQLDLDLIMENVETPRLFEWNLMHHSFLTKSCISFEGILYAESSDNGAPESSIDMSLAPVWKPTPKIGWIVSSRGEDQRTQMGLWLKAAGITYHNLILLNSGSDRTTSAATKADFYTKSGAALFLENSEYNAVRIAEATRMPVWCAETRQIIQLPHTLGSITRRTLHAPLDTSLKRNWQRIVRRLFSN